MPNCAPPQPPTPGLTPNFLGNMASGFSRFGCQFIYKRHDIQASKLRLLQNSINPNSVIGTLLEPILIDYAQGVLQGPPPLPPGPPPGPPIPNPNNPPVPISNIGVAVPMNPNFASFGGWSNQTGCGGLNQSGWSNLASGTSLPPAVPLGPGAGFTTPGPNPNNPNNPSIPLPPPPPPNIYMQAWTIFTTPIQAAGTVGTHHNWQQLLENRIGWLNNFALQNCTGGPTPPPPTPPTPPTPPFPPAGMVVCDSCNGGSPISNVFPNSCPPGWMASGTGNPCASTGGGPSTGGPTPPPPNPPTNPNTGLGGGGIVNNGFTSY